MAKTLVILFLINGQSLINNFSITAVHEFSSMESCEAAKKQIINTLDLSATSGQCVEVKP